MDTGSRMDDRRTSPRVDADDVIRWKRPGRIEDHKGWATDRSESGLGFITDSRSAPRIGDRLHLRRLKGDRWETIEDIVRVARVTPTSCQNLVTVGCAVAVNLTGGGGGVARGDPPAQSARNAYSSIKSM